MPVRRTGDITLWDQFPHSVAGVVAGDYRMDGRNMLIVVSVEGVVRGYLPVGVTSQDSGDVGPTPLLLEQQDRVLKSLTQKRHDLRSELAFYEKASSEPSKSLVSGVGRGVNFDVPVSVVVHHVIGAKSAAGLGVTVTVGSPIGSHTHTSDSVIRCILLTAHGLFPGKSFLHYPPVYIFGLGGYTMLGLKHI